ncbi:MAG: hypothetical protein ACJ779_02595 [Chloroflexota bacterium]|jgi:hypothetical protein
MTTRSIVCVECGTSVPYGRLGCPACGAMLASVGRRPAAILGAVAMAPEPEPEPLLLADDDVTPTGAASAPEDGHPTRLGEIAGWYVVVGATMVVLGFVLPWSRAAIADRSGVSFEPWAITTPLGVALFASALVVLALGIVRTSVPVWLRSGVLPVALGCLVIGAGWSAHLGPTGGGIGAAVASLGGLALVIGGVVSIWTGRHAALDPVV